MDHNNAVREMDKIGAAMKRIGSEITKGIAQPLSTLSLQVVLGGVIVDSQSRAEDIAHQIARAIRDR